MTLIDQLARVLRPISLRIRSIVARGVIKDIDDDGATQKIGSSFLKGEYIGRMEHPQTYGFTANPHIGMETIAVFADGDRSRGIIIAVGDRKFRVRGMQSGEVAMYTDEGDTILMGRGHKITATTETFTINAKKFIVNSPDGIEFSGALTTDDKITSGGDINSGGDVKTSGGISLDNHPHQYVDTQPNGSPATKNTNPPSP
jgi:phage baseplate assembly protein V